jgi:Protein of unknown function (DUF3500)
MMSCRDEAGASWRRRAPRPEAGARERWLVATALAAVAVLVSACGGSGGSASSAPTASSSASATASTAGVQGVVDAANAFVATLSDDQKAKALLEFNTDNAAAWSNLPCGDSCRKGVPFADLSDDQIALGKKVLQASLGTGGGTGYDQAMQILLADDQLGAAQANGTGGGPGSTNGPSGGGTPPSGSGGPPSGGAAPGGGVGGGQLGGSYSAYSSKDYLLGFLGAPATTGTWELIFGGHHLAVHITYKDGAVAGASPFFIGVEPTSWTADDGTKYAPLDIMKSGMLGMTQGLNADQLAKAKLADSYTDVLVGPGKDGQFPATKEGLQVSSLSADQKKLVMAAMAPWVKIVNDQASENLLATYQSELDQTYIGYSGGTGLTDQGDYVRIDGPGVWIEFVCQNGVVFSNAIHYHTIYRDHTRDYGGELSF